MSTCRSSHTVNVTADNPPHPQSEEEADPADDRTLPCHKPKADAATSHHSPKQAVPAAQIIPIQAAAFAVTFSNPKAAK